MSSTEPLHQNSTSTEQLYERLGDRVRRQVPVARYTAARVGGPADVLIEVRTSSELAETVEALWGWDMPFLILGGGSNVLVSDAGVRGVVIINQAREVRFDVDATPPNVWAESGANFGMVARQAAVRGLSGLEWAVSIPGTVGGAVVGNAGAHSGDIAGSLLVADILHRESGREQWHVDRLAYQYRSSALKKGNPSAEGPVAVVLSAQLRLGRSTPEAVQAQMDEYIAHRRRTQPPGASMGSMFKNPPGDYAGRLIEAAGLKGARVGDAQISTLHANFFINLGQAKAADVYELIRTAQIEVAGKYGMVLELEIELVGEWSLYRGVDGINERTVR